MTVEAMKQAMPLYTAYKQVETLLIMLNSPVSKVDCNCASVSIPPPSGAPAHDQTDTQQEPQPPPG